MTRHLAIGFSAAMLLITTLVFGLLLQAEDRQSEGSNIFNRSYYSTPPVRWERTADTSSRSVPVVVSGDLYFAGERVPLDDRDVRERLDRELQINVYWHSSTMLLMKTANRYFPEIERILAEEGVPEDFKYMPLVESGFRDQVSPAGAVGFWQFLKETAKERGLEVNEYVDERYHVELSTRAACRFLKQAKEKLGSWTLAAAAFNMGIDGLRNRLEDQEERNYYALFLNSETSRYVFRMLAAKIIFQAPHNGGFFLEDSDLYPAYAWNEVKVDTTIVSIAHFARENGLRYKEIKLLNPWLRAAQLPNKSGKAYKIRLLKAAP
jgi:hypothetical protein